MPSKLGATIRKARLAANVGLRELARRIDKSPALLSRIECDDVLPPVSPDTLRAIAEALELDVDDVLLAAARTEELKPSSKLEIAFYRRMQALPKSEREKYLREAIKELDGDSKPT